MCILLYADRAGLFCGVLKSLLSHGPDCPKVLATTHFHDVFKREMLDPQTLPISFVHMEVMFTTRNGEIIAHRDRSMTAGTDDDGEYSAEWGLSRQVARREKITYLYRVAQGLSLHSHAVQCAKLFGIPPGIVQRAQYVSQLLSDHEIHRLLDEEMSDAEHRKLEEAEEVGRRFLALDLQAQLQGDGVTIKEILGKILRKHGDADVEEMQDEA
ncbi:hypothetical protein EWM64_g3536 [Hericium alpestre]|uniref:DNA mismatch repair proteins mutS family domain-containing protein n=1 Tax=Hericium alpestre TaxID=135208 RepID=A0A4Z0A079_9AGAM|nr:hypothetical protein EWM64_g3536 [Hericium alpestre]